VACEVAALTIVVHPSRLRRILTRLFVMGGTIALLPIGQQVSLRGHFDCPVVLEAACPLAKGYGCRVRQLDDFRQTTFTARQDVHLICWIAMAKARTM
jgi:hypothetical protein